MALRNKERREVMAFTPPLEKYAGKIREVVIGKGDKVVKLGGHNAMPGCTFDGDFPNLPKIALEVFDSAPEDWAPEAIKPYEDVVNDPVAWAKKAVDVYNAELVCLHLKSTDPNGENVGADEAAQLAKKVSDSISVPLIVLGSGNAEKDGEVAAKVCEVCAGQNLLVGLAVEDNYKKIGAAAIGYGHCVAAQSPIDVNLAKQLNILLDNLGVPLDKIVMEPSTGALGYGIEYTYSVMERIELAALSQNDDKMQLPIMNIMAVETWKTREAKLDVDAEPTFGDLSKRGILWEAMTAVDLILSGTSLLIMRHPEAVRLTKEIIEELYLGK